ncbi:hypothetical protein BDR04DRAFT_127898 [Suillus decipiens]|nr:hypothetical protein BDR04DRAFT_127898 [Suillus decipiens]
MCNRKPLCNIQIMICLHCCCNLLPPIGLGGHLLFIRFIQWHFRSLASLHYDRSMLSKHLLLGHLSCRTFTQTIPGSDSIFAR